LLRKRSESQPVQTANAGSVFRNPPGDYAARLLESAGLKGFSIGTARFSPVHSNFIENQGNATAQDIENLISHAVDKVETVHGIELKLELRIIGNRV
jgi:UDP-N-acetylmuramate dehydrogenase